MSFRNLFKLTAVAFISLSSIAQGNVHQGRVDELKAQIKSVAKANTFNKDLEAVRSELDPLVDELISLTPEKTESEKFDLVVGGWRNLWSDLGFGVGLNSKKIGIQNDQVYQVVSPNGFYYNISQVKLGKLNFTTLLRGQFENEEEYLRIEFTANRLRTGFYRAGTYLPALIENFELNYRIDSVAIPGPIGVKGYLYNVYVDEDLRIVTGNSDNQEDIDLFILERADYIQ